MPETESRTMHELKVVPPYFDRLADGTKPYEVRKDDRGFQRGDALHLREWQPATDTGGSRYTGRSLYATVGHVFRQGFGVDLGEYVVLGLVAVEVRSLGLAPGASS